ncbi:Uncharacterised protein [Klebsiella oxytoca]|uniref:hypothetical protein n=1 Tax=Klebsiella TaxID=570 RepID=UPI0006498ECE|nr:MULTISPECIES: hypothetical protein [Klebsiella]AKL09199.1 hypothetical protein AB184_29775 [Klebsiella oxytoca]AKL26142.1 hypothetical protein AB181_30085 [Klebsiella oxytoca]APB44361.1 hypothetical protein AGF18_10670 [Klebsiella oxytoca]EKU2837445.1 hypothetical protein [Klebsiella oxytoca]ELB5498262.1 hypothetical protein [Klebsiella oxytoca]
MKIKSQGFAIVNPNNNIKTTDIIDYFIKQSTHEIKRADYDRQILLSDDGQFYTGLVLTYKNQKKNCLSTVKNGQFEIKVEDIQGDNKLVNFNFFCINKVSLKGLYLYYRGSCSLNSLFSSWQSYSNFAIRKKIKNEVIALGKKPDKIKVESIHKKYEKRLEFRVIIDKSSLIAMLSTFSEIKSATFRYDSVDFKESEMIGVEQFTRNTEVTFNISDNNKSKVSQIANSLDQMVNKISGITKGVVSVVDHSKNERLIDLINSPCYFSEYDFDTIAQHVNGLKNDNYISNAIIQIIKDEITNGRKKHEFN